MSRSFTVRAEWDDEAKVWYVAESDVPGLATESPSVDGLMAKLRTMVPELLELNGVVTSGADAVPVHLLAPIGDGPRDHH